MVQAVVEVQWSLGQHLLQIGESGLTHDSFYNKQLQLRDEWMITQRNDMYLGKVYSVLDFDCMDLLKIWILVDTFISSIKNYIPCGA